MILHGVFPDAEKAVLAWLGERLRARGFNLQGWSELPEGWEDDDVLMPLPAFQVERVPAGGGTGNAYEGSAYLDVTVWARTRAELWPIVQQVEVAMVALPGRGPVMFDDMTHPQKFGEVPYANRRVRRAVGSFELISRAQ